MATIVLSAIGTAIGGPLGGALGALIGNQVDKSLIGSGRREGPRLKELGITTSSYGTPIARHYGTMRAPGSIIWATDLIESSERSGGGKSKPSVTTYSYSTSFAVAVASRPITGIGRIWADGNLLRGAAGDLKTGGELRIYTGHGNQAADPLIASDKGPACPAFRGLAYCVFESLQLADFGNRIPALTFEVIADDGTVSLSQMLPETGQAIAVDRPVDALVGYSHEGGPIAAELAAIDQVYPITCDASGARLTILAADILPQSVVTLPEPAADRSAESFASLSGASTRRQPDLRDIPEGLRYYDVARDFQAGLQRAGGRARAGRSRVLEFPGALSANSARDLVNKAAERASWSSEGLSWRMVELDPELTPGQVVRVPGKAGLWRIEAWEWRDTGLELDLAKLPHGPARVTAADAGTALPAADLAVTPTQMIAFEVPWDGQGVDGQRQVLAAASSASGGWKGAAIYAENAGALSPLDTTGRTRSIIGETAEPLAPASCHLIRRDQSVEIELASSDFVLANVTPAGLAVGRNRAWLGGEVIQFAKATRVSGARWRISQLLRGRGGTERAAQVAHEQGSGFVLLDGTPLALDAVALGQAPAVAAAGLGDVAPVMAPILDVGRTLRPLAPVHPFVTARTDGSLDLRWTRRARGAWTWLDQVDVPLGEQTEKYLLGIGDPEGPAASWPVESASYVFDAATWAGIQAEHAGRTLWVRQVGNWSSSDPLLLAIIA